MTQITTSPSSKTTNDMVRKMMIHNLWEVTEFIASHTGVVMNGSVTHNAIQELSKLRDIVNELEIIN